MQLTLENCFMSDVFFETIHKIKSLNPNLDTTELTKNLINYSMLYFKLNSKDQKLSIYSYEDFLNNLVGYFEKAQKEDFFRNKKWDCTRIGEDKNLHHSAYAALALDFMTKNGFKKTDFENEETRYAIMSLLDTKIWGTDMIYHAFNSYNLQSIKENGLDPTANKKYQADIDAINEIFKKHNISMAFGWQKINSENKISYSTTTAVSYHYGIRSPEWFSQFCGDGTHFYNVEGIDRNAYINKDYKAAKKNMEIICSKYGFSEQEQKMVLEFFDNYWKKFENSQPMLAVVPKKGLAGFYVDIFVNYNLDEAIASNEKFQPVDAQSTTTIDTKNAIYIAMPTPEQVKQKLKEIDKKYQASQQDQNHK